MKRLFRAMLAVALAATIALPSVGMPAEAAKPISVLIDGVRQTYDPAPVVVKGRTLVPMRPIFEQLGMIIEWDDKTRTVRGYTMSDDLKLTIDSKWAFLNDRAIALDVPAQLVKGRTMVAIRFVGEALGAQVSWNEATSTVTIKSAHSMAEGGYMRDLMKTDDFWTRYGELEFNLREAHAMYSDWAVDQSTPGTPDYVPSGVIRQRLLDKFQEADAEYSYFKALEAYDQDLQFLLERYDQVLNVFLFAVGNDSTETRGMLFRAYGELSDLMAAMYQRRYPAGDGGSYGCDSPFCWYYGSGGNGGGAGNYDPYDPFI
ncbi:copper amine oxidase-like protein [Tumebacillus sp. BK434]|uniref:copper amine oxidase N-terminal domain-containing protein n=1 Tax=Tumebacillus sp. BK434 TaxID=2512169 RepID=UPI00104AA641|nr:copper amine oxidase N-terminal domain-containing protein [Tumebacillus sp. BK434]TCP58163.1 copper amine oxidase-like protein [Tumebacillus sp. BK434]